MVVAPRSVVARHKLRHAVTFTIAVAAHAITPATAHAQRLEDLAPGVRQFVSVESTSVLIEHVLLNDGTGTPARDAMSVLIEDGRIAAVAPSGQQRAQLAFADGGGLAHSG